MTWSDIAVGGSIGLVAAVGLLLVMWRLRARTVTFDQRLAPYVGRRDSRSALLHEARALTPFPVLEQFIGPWIRSGVAHLERLTNNSEELERRLIRAGRGRTSEQFRAEQILWASAGLVGGLVAALGLTAVRGIPVPMAAALVVICGLAMALWRDRVLTGHIQQRESDMLREFPTLADLLALAVAAGEAPVAALARISRVADGELARELRATLADVHAGSSLTTALEALADRTGLAALARFAEGVVVAIERGTPIAQVLRSQAQDVREQSRRALMELGGRKEVAMLIPVVFIIMPVTVIFAVFPSILVVNVGG